MQFKPTHFILGACVVTALACGGGGGTSNQSGIETDPKQRSYTPINLTYDNTTVDIKINGADILNSASAPIGKSLVAWPATTALVPSFRTTSPQTPAGQVPYEIKKTGGAVLTLPTLAAKQTASDRHLFVISGTESAIRGFYIPFLVPNDTNPVAVVSVTHLAAPTFAGSAAVPAAVDVHLTAPGAAPTLTTKAIIGILYQTFPDVFSPFGYKFVAAAGAGAKDVVITAKDSLTVVARRSITITKNFNHFIILSRNAGVPTVYSYDYKYWNLP